MTPPCNIPSAGRAEEQKAYPAGGTRGALEKLRLCSAPPDMRRYQARWRGPGQFAGTGRHPGLFYSRRLRACPGGVLGGRDRYPVLFRSGNPAEDRRPLGGNHSGPVHGGAGFQPGEPGEKNREVSAGLRGKTAVRAKERLAQEADQRSGGTPGKRGQISAAAVPLAGHPAGLFGAGGPGVPIGAD